MKVIKGKNNREAKIWVQDLAEVEPETINQIKSMLELPHLFGHIAIMPDTHLGKGAVVGGVVAAKGAVVPNIVGVDIGCGVSAYYTGLEWDKDVMSKEFWMNWKTQVSRTTPTGFNSHKDKQDLGQLDLALKAKPLQSFIRDKAPYQMGTLGGGNHFIEAQADENNIIWLMVHSGSRHTGLQIATYYNNLARDLDKKYRDKAPLELWYLKTDDQTGQDYLYDMGWAIDFALENRWRMLENMAEAFKSAYNKHYSTDPGLLPVRETGINIHHNFANPEEHFGQTVIVHRKGATQAQADQIGIIPGSMGTPSYIVRGLGNPESYKSCAHGAGRKMSRHQAKRTIDQNMLQESLKHTFTKASSNIIDEAPGAYKDIDEVMTNQLDLVAIIHKLTPIITVKGEGD